MNFKDPVYKNIVRLMVPIALQGLLSAVVNSVDVVMLNFVGQSAVSAVSLAANYAGILYMVFSGLGTGLTILCAQYFGKKDFRSISTVEGISLRFTLIVSFAAFITSFLCPEAMMRPFTDDRELIALGAEYLRYTSVSFFCWGIIECYSSTLRSISRVTVCTAMNAATNVINIFLNAAFIFGWFGLPFLGVRGVAMATSISRIIALACFMVVSFRSRDVKLDFRLVFAKNPLLFKDFLRISIPALGNDIAWGLAFSVYAAIMGHMGSDAVAAYSFVGVVRNFGTVLCYAVAGAGGLILGQIMGQGKIDEAKATASKIMHLTLATAIVGGVLVLGIIPLALKFANITPQAKIYLKYMLLINLYYIMGTAVNTTLIVGVFRAGGDSKFGLVCDIIDMWVYAVPLGLLCAFILKLPVIPLYIVLCTDEFVKWPWVISHYKSGRWAKNITRDFSGQDSTGTK